MNIRDLIAELSEFNPDAPVVVSVNEPGEGDGLAFVEDYGVFMNPEKGVCIDIVSPI